MGYASIIISVISLGITLWNHINYRKLQAQYNEIAKVQAQAALGALETQIRSAITGAYRSVVDIGLRLKEHPEDEALQKAYAGAEEVYLNAYEDACGKYNDGKIDRERFRKMYLSEIRRLVEEEPYNNAYSGNDSKYTATLKVFREWYRNE